MPRTLTDHDSIRQWASERGASPAFVTSTLSRPQPGGLRFDFGGTRGEEALVQVDWNRWFERFDASGLALVVDDRTNASELVPRRSDQEGPAGSSRSKTDTERAAAQRTAADGREADMARNDRLAGAGDDDPDDEDGEDDDEDLDDDLDDDEEDEDEEDDEDVADDDLE